MHRYSWVLLLIVALAALSCAASPTATSVTSFTPANSVTSTSPPPSVTQTPPVTISLSILPPSTSPSPSPTMSAPSLATRYSYRVISSYPHDPDAFTQGLVYENGYLYEGTGLNGRSSLRQVELTTGSSLQQRNLPLEYFGEGITIFGERIYQLTWQSKAGFIYRQDNFAPTGNFSYNTEGWGLTHDGRQLIMSDGTASLHFLDPVTLKVTSTIQVTDKGQPLKNINELEYINGLVYANIWQTDLVAVIDPSHGNVLSWIDLTGLLDKQKYPGANVLNGIAYDVAGQRLFVTGKLWPLLFEIELVPAA